MANYALCGPLGCCYHLDKTFKTWNFVKHNPKETLEVHWDHLGEDKIYTLNKIQHTFLKIMAFKAGCA